MFTGIIANVGKIVAVDTMGTDADAGLRLTIDAGGLPLEDVALGDSIAINGACMTVIAKDANGFAVDVSRESLNHTVGLDQPGAVNLEKALRVGDRLGGHLVSGHVDGLGRVVRFEPLAESWRLEVEAPAEFSRCLAYKGSVVINGVSLTVNTVEDVAQGCRFSINLIPHTVSNTTLKSLCSGALVNLEIDLIARYVERMLSTRSLP